MYSLISAPVLGFDLTRLAGGADVAEILTAAILAGPAELELLAGCAPADSDAMLRARAAAHLAAATTVFAVPGAAGRPPGQRVLTVLERAPIGTLAALLRMLNTDVIGRIDDVAATAANPGDINDSRVALIAVSAGTAEAAATVVENAVIASYLRDGLADEHRRVLVVGWLAARRRLPVTAVDLGPQHDAVCRLLARIGTLRSAELAVLTRAADRARTGRGWSAAMHSATWAVQLSGRQRSAAVAQLLLVHAVELAGVPVAARAAGVWNLLSGTVQAVMVRDLLDDLSAPDLLMPCLSALGPGWLTGG